MDKHKQIQIKNENKYDELLVFFKNNGDDKISSLSQEIGALKQTLNDKTEEINELTFKNEDLNNILREKEQETDELTEKIE